MHWGERLLMVNEMAAIYDKNMMGGLVIMSMFTIVALMILMKIWKARVFFEKLRRQGLVRSYHTNSALPWRDSMTAYDLPADARS